MKRFCAIVAVLLTPFVSQAESAKPAKEAKAVTCRSFRVFKDDAGHAMASCDPSKAGGKPVYLRSFIVSSLTDPETSQPVKVLVGFR